MANHKGTIVEKIISDDTLFHVLLKNLPAKIHCSHTKSGAYSKPALETHIALKGYEFIEFNSDEKITIIILDKDFHHEMSAMEYFGDLSNFCDWLVDQICIAPTYVCQTTKGFQFGFVIKGFLTIQNGYKPKNSPEHYLRDIKAKLIKFLSLDPVASGRNKGVFRNPLKHKYVAFPDRLYDLHDLNNVVKDIKFNDNLYTSFQERSIVGVGVNKKITDNRNVSIFKLCCYKFAYSKPTKQMIFNFCSTINTNNCYEPLPLNELKSITNSIYKRTQDNTLKSSVGKAKKNQQILVKQRKKDIIKYFLNAKKLNIKPRKVDIARKLGITVKSLNKTYGQFIKIKYRI